MNSQNVELLDNKGQGKLSDRVGDESTLLPEDTGIIEYKDNHSDCKR